MQIIVEFSFLLVSFYCLPFPNENLHLQGHRVKMTVGQTPVEGARLLTRILDKITRICG